MSSESVLQRRLTVPPPYAGSTAQQAYEAWLGHCRTCSTCKTGSGAKCVARKAAWRAYVDAGGTA